MTSLNGETTKMDKRLFKAASDSVINERKTDPVHIKKLRQEKEDDLKQLLKYATNSNEIGAIMQEHRQEMCALLTPRERRNGRISVIIMLIPIMWGIWEGFTWLVKRHFSGNMDEASTTLFMGGLVGIFLVLTMYGILYEMIKNGEI